MLRLIEAAARPELRRVGPVRSTSIAGVCSHGRPSGCGPRSPSWPGRRSGRPASKASRPGSWPRTWGCRWGRFINTRAGSLPGFVARSSRSTTPANPLKRGAEPMVARTFQCDAARLKSFLDDDLPEREQARAERSPGSLCGLSAGPRAAGGRQRVLGRAAAVDAAARQSAGRWAFRFLKRRCIGSAGPAGRPAWARSVARVSRQFGRPGVARAAGALRGDGSAGPRRLRRRPQGV